MKQDQRNMARNTKTHFKVVLLAFLIVVVGLYHSAKENAFSWLKKAKNGK